MYLIISNTSWFQHNAKSEGSEKVTKLHRDLIVADEWTEPYSPWQNPSENRGVKFIKAQAQVIMNRVNAPANTWFLCQEYVAYVHSICAHPELNWKTPVEVAGEDTPDISPILQFYWFEPVYYLDPDSHPKSGEKPGYFVGIPENVGDILTYKILTGDKKKLLHRSVVRSARDPKSQNRRVKFKDPIKIEEEYNPYKFPMELHPSLKEKEKEVPKEQSKETPKPKFLM